LTAVAIAGSSVSAAFRLTRAEFVEVVNHVAAPATSQLLSDEGAAATAAMRTGAIGRLWSAADPHGLGFVEPAALTQLAERMRGTGPRQRARLTRPDGGGGGGGGGGAAGGLASSALAQEWSPEMMAAVQRRVLVRMRRRARETLVHAVEPSLARGGGTGRVSYEGLLERCKLRYVLSQPSAARSG
jgi:hypothetical protein